MSSVTQSPVSPARRRPLPLPPSPGSLPLEPTDSTRPVGPDGTSTYHIYYEPDLLCGRFKSNPAQICKYSPSKDNPLLEGT